MHTTPLLPSRFARLLPSVLTAVCLLAVPAAHAKPPAAPHGPGAAYVSQVAEGQVQRLLINPYGDVDGLLLTDGRVVKFAPHMGTELAANVAPGDTVRVAGRFEGFSTIKAYSILNVNSGYSVQEQPPASGLLPSLPRHLRGVQLTPQQAEGVIGTVLSGARGQPKGVILQTGEIVYFPPHGAYITPLQPGQYFVAQGLGTRNQYGLAFDAVRVGGSWSTLHPLYRD